MGSTAQLYNLGWREFGVSLKSAVQGLRSKGDLMDVTLAAGGKTFPAHKLVLSAASPLLLELLKVTPCQHPVILLAGIGASDLESLLEFVYSGEVSVHPSQLPSLLQAAHVLNIHGLVQGTITAEKPENQSVADAAMKASTAANQKMSITSLAAATSAGLAAAVGNAGDGVRRRRRAKRKTSDCSDGPNDKWGRCDSGAESSDAETHSKDLRCTITAQTVQSQASISQIHVGQQNNIQMGSSNSISAPEPGAKPSKQSIGTLTSLSIVPGTLKSGLVKSESGLVVGSQSSNQNITQGSSDNPGSVNHDGSMVPPHHLDLTSADDDDNNTHSGDDTYSAIAAAADAAALAASTLADKKGISEQPAACPLCNAIIRQSRNLRRHLELKHFGGKKPKKGKGKRKTTRLNQCDTDTESNAGSVADTTVIEHVQVEMKSPSLCDTVLSSVPPSASSSPTQTPPPKHPHTLTELQPAQQQHQSVEAYLQQQQLQQLQIDQFPHHMAPPTANSTYQIPYPHPHPHLQMLRGDPHALMSGDSAAYRSHAAQAVQQQFASMYSDSTRSSTHQ